MTNPFWQENSGVQSSIIKCIQFKAVSAIYLLCLCIFWGIDELLVDSWAWSCWVRCHPGTSILTCPGGSTRGVYASAQCWLKKPLDILFWKEKDLLDIDSVTFDYNKILLTRIARLKHWYTYSGLKYFQ